MRLPIPTVPVSTQSVGQFSAPTAAPMQDAGPQQLEQLGASLMTAGAAAARIGVDVQQDLDQGFLMESDAVASELARGVVGSYRQKTGLAAIEQFKDTQTGLRDQMRNLSDSARSPRQKQALERMLAQRMQDASESMASHRDVQARNRAIGGAEAGVMASLNDYQAAIGNPADMELAREVAMQRTAELSRLRGEDGDMAKLAMLDTTTRMHAVALDSLLAAGRATEAAAYLESAKSEMAPQEAAKAARVVKRATVADKGQKLANDFDQTGMGLADQYKAVEQLYANKELTVEERDEAIERIDRVQVQKQRARAVEVADVLTKGEALLAGSLDAKVSDDPTLYAKAEELGVLPQLLQFERARRPAEDPVAIATALSIPDDELAQVTRQQLVQQFWGRIGFDDLKSLLSRRDSAANRANGGGSAGGSAMQSAVWSIDDQIIDAAADLFGWPKDGKVKDGSEPEFIALRKSVQARIAAEEALGGKVDRPRLQQIMDEAKMDTVSIRETDLWGVDWMDSDQPSVPMAKVGDRMADAYTMADGVQVFVGKVPADIRAHVVQTLIRNGRPVTERLVAEAWVRMREPASLAEARAKGLIK